MILSAHKIFDRAFSRPRDPRSAEYKAGVMAALRFRIEGTKINRPYRIGTAAADAFFSGISEGHSLWREEEVVVATGNNENIEMTK